MHPSMLRSKVRHQLDNTNYIKFSPGNGGAIIIIIIIVYYATKAANIHSYTYKNTIKNKTKFKKNSITVRLANNSNSLIQLN